jgi:hypothetical protein
MLEDLYPDVIKIGGLAKALDIEFIRIQSSLRCSIDKNIENLPFAYARVENKKRFSQIHLAAEETLYLPDFWRNGVCLAHGKTKSISKLAEVLHYWLTADATTDLLQNKFEFVKANEKSQAFDENKEVDYTWKLILNDSSRADIKSFVELAIKDHVLSKLFPFTSLTRLCFSRCTGYPYTYDTPIVIPVSKELYEVRLSNNDIVGRGNAPEALKMVKDNLPINIQSAIPGTAEDL